MKIVIADDHAVVRSGFSMIINYQEDMEVVATAADGLEAYAMVAKHRPDVLLMDLSMPPGESGLIATGKISADYPGTKIIVLTMYDDEDYLFHVLKNGASGYVLKNAPDDELISAIRMVYAGGTYIHPQMATSLVREFIKKDSESPEQDPLSSLSQRELEILPLIAKGYGNKEIAEMLYVSVKTVEAHKAKIMEKLNLKSRPQLVEYALKKKLLDF
ncbi:MULTISPECIES: response regulator transcription factor [Paenibacillus]|uniref:Two component transcriptional regulator, LuxR family n=2 Tax=Paenibacillus lactis TaxID=228574 RepID=G4HG32_9BACL|nr:MULTISPECIES: response regulator transcription factor [Paenibacillus]EHB64043.1 two component transcriptional regulator, LuxR family [Paenibacillus lactis 154]MBP1895312.1 two-component system response regulator NreC [Paenibacillus lactis]HAF97790.1 DNA-binding response regulator [Paenibacillus lactis]